MPVKKSRGKKGKKNTNKKKIEKVMHEFKHGELHSGSKSGPIVDNPKQAIAIALSESRKKSSLSKRIHKKPKKVKKGKK